MNMLSSENKAHHYLGTDLLFLHLTLPSARQVSIFIQVLYLKKVKSERLRDFSKVTQPQNER